MLERNPKKRDEQKQKKYIFFNNGDVFSGIEKGCIPHIEKTIKGQREEIRKNYI